MSELVLRNRQRVRRVNIHALRRIVCSLVDDLLGIDAYELGIHLVAEPEMVRLNETFMRHAGSTDVITFNHDVAADVRRLSKGNVKSEPPGLGCYGKLHGELFVCVDEAVFQAKRFRTSWQSELVRYIVHGVLHLRGFDDRQPAARRKMKREENRLLRLLTARFRLSGLARKTTLQP
jgi:probable rRNA maturation factor